MEASSTLFVLLIIAQRVACYCDNVAICTARLLRAFAAHLKAGSTRIGTTCGCGDPLELTLGDIVLLLLANAP